MPRIALVLALLSVASLALPCSATTAPKVRAAAVYSKAAKGVWIVARVTLNGCENGAAIEGQGTTFSITIKKSSGPICPQMIHDADFARFFPMAAMPKSVRIDAADGTAFPYAVGLSDPLK